MDGKNGYARVGETDRILADWPDELKRRVRTRALFDGEVAKSLIAFPNERIRNLELLVNPDEEVQMAMAISGPRPARRAFSLLEMLAVVTIMAIIASIVLPRVAFHAFSAKQKACLKYRSSINSAIEKYMFDHGTPPTQLSDLESEDYFPESIPLCPTDHTAYTIDPTTHRVSGHNH